MDNKATIIAVCAALLLLTLVIACSKGCNKPGQQTAPTHFPQQQKVSKSSKTEKDPYEDWGKSPSSVGSSHGGSSYSDDESAYGFESDTVPPDIISEEQKKILEARFKKDDEEITKINEELAQEFLKRTDFTAKQMEQLKLRTNKNFVTGMNAYKEKDYKTAVKNFNVLAQDKTASPVSRYFAISGIMDTALAMHDVELYFLAARMRAALAATEDLTLIGIHKNTDSLDWVEKVENTLKASKNDKKSYNKCIQLKMDKGYTKETAERMVAKDIEFYTNKFKELLNE